MLCRNDAGRQVVIIEQQKRPRLSLSGKEAEPVFDYITEDGEIANRLEDGRFLLLLSDEVFLVA